MKIITILNNSALIAQNEKKEEYVLIGKGISFQKHPNDKVDMSKVEKQFGYNTQVAKELYDLVNEIPEKYLDITCSIIRYANKKLGRELNKNIYISLLDHINSAVERYQEGIQLDFAMENEVRVLYGKEYRVAEWALEYLNMTLDIDLPIDECGFITIHLINASSEEGNIMKTKKVMRISKDIADVVKEHFCNKIDIESMDYSRFITHLKYFALRCLSEKQLLEDVTISFHFAKETLEIIDPCLDKVSKCLLEKHDLTIASNEMKYLTLHLCRLIHI